MRYRHFALIFFVSMAAFASAQSNGNKANWTLANRFSTQNMQLWVGSTTLNPTFVGKTDKFWYRWRDMKGARFMFVDPDKKKKDFLFDHNKMAALLSAQTKKPYDALNLPFQTVSYQEKTDAIRFTVDSKQYEYDRVKETLKELPSDTPAAPRPTPPFGGQGGQGAPQAPEAEYRNWAPDKKCFVYAQNHNLYFVEVSDDKEKKEGEPIQLTTDGVEYYSFGSTRSFLGGDSGTAPDPTRKVRPNVTWSPDSLRFFTMRTDSRKVKDFWLVNVLSQPRPTLMTYKYALPGEEDVSTMELYGFARSDKKLTKLKVEKYKDQRLQNAHWPNTSEKLRLIRRDRLQRNLELIEYDFKLGFDKVIFSESVENAFLETRQITYIKEGEGFLWWSERTGWGHIYQYNADGTLKNAVTSGAWRAENILQVDAEKGFVYFTGVGKTDGENPYYEHLYKCKLDGTELLDLTPGNVNHNPELSPSKRFVVDNMSRVDMPPKIVLRNWIGDTVLPLEETDVSRLTEIGWRTPEVFNVKSADGVYDVFGNMWKPFDFDPNKKYPIIMNIYPGPQTEGVTDTFAASGSTLQLAQLGFIVIQIGNRGGNPQRSNAYHSYGYFNLRDYGLADKQAAVEQLAAKYPWIDIDKVGIYGHSGGGFMTAAAMMMTPYNSFFKVGVSSAGNHDNNIYNQNWSEQHHGLREVKTAGTTGTGVKTPVAPEELADVIDAPFQLTKFEIKVPTTVEIASNLKGKLLLVHGTMDNNVHPGNTERLVDSLIKANKRFDFMPMPGQAHGFGPMQPYFQQMLMEYFAEHLLGDRYRGSSEISDKRGG
jgi:dipeptidyl aminopeptidase/acylaminoacyl peptidase